MHVTNYVLSKGFPCGAMVKNPPAKAGDLRDEGSIQGLGRSPGEGNGDRLQYSCLENPMDRGAWRAVVHRVTKSWTELKQLNMHVRIKSLRASQVAQL